MAKSAVFLIGMIFMTSLAVFASGDHLSVYIHDEPFSGSTLRVGNQVYLESEALAVALNLPERYLFPQRLERLHAGKRYVSLAGVAKLFYATVIMNFETGIVDFYSPRAGGSSVQGPVVVMPLEQASGVASQTSSTSGYCSTAYPPYYHYLPYLPYYSAYAFPLPIRVPPNVHFSNGVLPEDAQGHWVPLGMFF